MLISIIIPTYNRSALLRKTLPSLLSQTVEPWFDYEILFISNGSSDDTGMFLQQAELLQPERLRYFYIAPTGGPSAPRNHGIRLARGEVIIIQDDDVLPDANMVLAHAKFHLQHPTQQAAALGEVYVPSALASDPMSLFHSFPYGEVRKMERLTFLHFWTCNVSLKRAFMLDCGFFDENFLFYEDVICAYHLQMAGMQLRFLPAARGQHLHELKPEQIAAKGQFYGRWLYDFFLMYPYADVMDRFEIISRVGGFSPFLKSHLRRWRFRMTDNPLTWWLLRKAGADSGRRSRLSDVYYSYELRRNIFAGYKARAAQVRMRLP